jgi:hypothetical protein
LSFESTAIDVASPRNVTPVGSFAQPATGSNFVCEVAVVIS